MKKAAIYIHIHFNTFIHIPIQTTTTYIYLPGILKVKKAAAMKEAKDMHTSDIFDKMSREILERFKELRSEIEEKEEREDGEGKDRLKRGIRIGE